MYTLWFKTNIPHNGNILAHAKEEKYPQLQKGDIVELWIGQNKDQHHYYQIQLKIVDADSRTITFYCCEIVF